MEAILSRRSIRKYTSEPVPEETIHELLEAAMSAPSAGNEQPWHFVIIDERAILDKIPEFHPYSSMLKSASVAILVCGDETLERFKGYWVKDCAAATENMLIAIQDKGLGGVWLGVYPDMDRVESFRNLLGLPKHIIPFSLVALGYPAEEKPPANRFNENRIHHNKW